MSDIGSALAVDYGVQCSAQDEKRLVKNVNAFLASLDYRKMYKWQDTSVQPPDRTFRIEHYYCQFLKQAPRWHFDLRPNADLDGKARFPERPECGWLLHVRKPFPETYSAQDHEQLNRFFAGLVEGLGFPSKVLHVYQSILEERL